MSENQLLSRDSILTAEDLDFEIVDVPEWGGKVRVRALTGAERDDFEIVVSGSGAGKKENLANVRARLVAKSVVDEAGQPIFSDHDVTKLGLKNARPLNRVFNVARKLSGLTEEDVEELVADFDGAPGADSATG